MKKNTMLLLSVLLSMSNLYSQFSTKIGINIANQSLKIVDENEVDFDSRTGFLISAGFEHDLNDEFSIHPELAYISKGNKLKSKIYENRTVSFNYIELPVMVKYKRVVGPVNFYLNLGPNFGIALNAKIKDEDGDVEELAFGGEDQYKRFEFGLGIGGGLIYNIGDYDTFFDLRYNFGLSDIDADEDQTLKNTGFSIAAGIFL